MYEQSVNHISLKGLKLCKVSRCAGHVSANTRPHQPRMHVVIPCDHLCLNANTQNQGKKIVFQLLAYNLLSLTRLRGKVIHTEKYTSISVEKRGLGLSMGN